MSNNCIITPDTSNKTITVEGDRDLVAGNIKKGVQIFDVTGSVIEATGNATAADVLADKTFSNDSSAGVSGTMTNNGAVTITPAASNQPIAEGYHDGSGIVEGDSDLAAANIKEGVQIFGVTGSVIEATGDATDADVLDGKTFSNNSSAGVSGTMTNNGAVTITPAASNQPIAEGYHNGSGIVKGDPDLVADNIKKDVEIFGVTGTYEGYSAYPAPVPKTGQTTCYNASGNTIDCSGTGQDGDLKKGVAWPNPRFTDNNDGTVTDNLTGLIWLKNANANNGRMTWNAALDFANNLRSGNYGLSDGSQAGDWRLPNRFELRSLLDLQYYDPALSNTAGTEQWQEGEPFTNVQSFYYWSSTTNSNEPSYAWVVLLGYGSVEFDSKRDSDYVWPVRGGQ